MDKYLPKIIGALINFISYLSSQHAAKLAVLIFSKPKKGRLKKEEEDYLKSATQKKVLCNNIDIMTYHWVGKKDTLLLAHGWESNSFRWKNLIEILKTQDFNIIALDAPAHGKSGNKLFNAPLYSECINVVIKKFNPSIIIGHSIGATASVIALKNHNITSSIKKLILLGAPSNLAISVGNYVKLMDYNKIVIKAINQYYLKYFNQLPEYYCVENFYQNIISKGLIIHDKKDNIISFKEALDIHRVYKNSELIKTIGLGHRLRSEIVYNHILEFLNA